MEGLFSKSKYCCIWPENEKVYVYFIELDNRHILKWKQISVVYNYNHTKKAFRFQKAYINKIFNI